MNPDTVKVIESENVRLTLENRQLRRENVILKAKLKIYETIGKAIQGRAGQIIKRLGY